jgi:hypothetical protein
MAVTINGNGTITGIAVGGLPDGIVDNGTMADDAVAIADLAATGTASATTFLRGDNSWQEAGGAWAVKGSGETSFSGVGNVDITGLTKTTKIFFKQSHMTTTHPTRIRLSTDNGSSFDSGANYDVGGSEMGTSTAWNTEITNGANNFHITNFATPVPVAGAHNFYIEVTVVDPQNTTDYTLVTTHMYGQSDHGSYVGMKCMNYKVTSAVNAIRIYNVSYLFTGSYLVLELN